MMMYLRLLWLFAVCSMSIQASTHWMVTESGLIQPRIDSPFQMARPYDLLAFLNQDTRWENIINLYHDLSDRQKVIDKLWAELEQSSDVNAQIALDDNCLKAGQIAMLDWYGSFLEDSRSKKVPYTDLTDDYVGQEEDVPDCKNISPLTFSMFTFEHLEGMVQRENLSAEAEAGLAAGAGAGAWVPRAGTLAGALRRNATSWLHYHAASLHWRARGDTPRALECSRRAVLYAPRQYKDMALLNMGSILHRSRRTEDAVTVLNAAVDHDPAQPVNHFVLGNAYAVLGDYNSSRRHLERCLELEPGLDVAVRHRYGVLCHAALLTNIQTLQDTLQQLRGQLAEYGEREARWLRDQAAFLRTMRHDDDFDYRNVENNCARMTQLTGLDMSELKKTGDKNSLMQYFLEGPGPETGVGAGVHLVEGARHVQRLVRHVQRHAGMASHFAGQLEGRSFDRTVGGEIGPLPVAVPADDDDVGARPESVKMDTKDGKPSKTQSEDEVLMFEFEGGEILYPPSMKVSRTTQTFDRDPSWPAPAACLRIMDNFAAIYPTFMPFENKGISIKQLLTRRTGVPAQAQHPLPWHPPACPRHPRASLYTGKKAKPQVTVDVADTEYLRQKLLEYAADGDPDTAKRMLDAEIGHRIYVAMQKKLAPRWLLYALSALYWRVVDKRPAALNCLLQAASSVPARHRDVVLAPLASLLLELGHFDDALAAAEDAFRINLYEPATNFILAELNMVKRNRNTQLFHLKQVERVEPGFMRGVARGLLAAWGCLAKPHQQLDQAVSESCARADAEAEAGAGPVCEGGQHCRAPRRHCPPPALLSAAPARADGALLRLIELPDFEEDEVSGAAGAGGAFGEGSALERALREGAAGAGADAGARLAGALREDLQRCHTRPGCTELQFEDLTLKEEDCTYQHLQLGYWLHVISFQLLLTDPNLRLPDEMTTVVPSDKKVPECRLPDDAAEDLQERLQTVDTEGWEPLLSVMHQFVEMFDSYDYLALGAKIAKYVEIKSQCWRAALGAGWWCGAAGRGGCAVRCLAAAHALAPARKRHHALRALAALLHMQEKQRHAKDIAYLALAAAPKSKAEAFLVAVSHTYLAEYDEAVWMYRYALSRDPAYLPAKACLHATLCLVVFADSAAATPRDD